MTTLDRWALDQVAALIALGDSPQDAEQFVREALAWLPEGADPATYWPTEMDLAVTSGVSGADVMDARVDWYASDDVPPAYKRLLDARVKVQEGDIAIEEGGPGSGHWGHRGRPGKGQVGGSVPSLVGHAGTRVNREYWTVGPGRHLFEKLPEHTRENILATLATAHVWNSDLDGLGGVITDPLPQSGNWLTDGGGECSGWYWASLISINPHLNPIAGQTFVHELGHHVSVRRTYIEKAATERFGDKTSLIDSSFWVTKAKPLYEATKAAHTSVWLRDRGLREYSLTNEREFAADIYKTAVWGNAQQTRALADSLGLVNLRKLFPVSGAVLPSPRRS